MFLLPLDLGPLAAACGENSKFAYSAVQLKLDHEARTFTAEACDGRIMVRVEGEEARPRLEYPGEFLPSFPAPPTTQTLLVPGKFWTSAFAAAKKLIGRNARPNLRCVAVVGDGTSVALGWTDLDETPVARSRQVERRRPDYAGLLSKFDEGHKGGGTYDPALLGKVGKLLADLWGDSDGPGAKLLLAEVGMRLTVRRPGRQLTAVIADMSEEAPK